MAGEPDTVEELELEQTKEQYKADVDAIFNELLGTASDRMNWQGKDSLALTESYSFFDKQGTALANLVGAEGNVFGLRRLPSGDIEVSLFTGAEAAVSGRAALRMQVSYEDRPGSTTETRRVYDLSTASRSAEPSAVIATTIERGSGELTIAGSTGADSQTLRLSADGRPLALEVSTGGTNGERRNMSFTFGSDGKILDVSVNGTSVPADRAQAFRRAAEQMIQTVAAENRLPVPKFGSNEGPLPEVKAQAKTADSSEIHTPQIKPPHHDAKPVVESLEREIRLPFLKPFDLSLARPSSAPAAKATDIPAVKPAAKEVSAPDEQHSEDEPGDLMFTSFEGEDGPGDKPSEPPRSREEILQDFRRPGGPTTEEGRALLRLLAPTDAMTAPQVLAEMTRQLGAERAEQLLTRGAETIVRSGITAEQTPAFRRLLNLPTAAAGFYTALAGVGDNALRNASALVSGENPPVNSTNAEAVRRFLAPGASDVRAVLQNAHAESLPRIAQIAAETRAAHGEMTGTGWNGLRSGETGTGHRNQRWVFNGLEQVMQRPGPSGQPSLHEQGWRIVPGGNQSTADRAGMDFVLVNVRSGQWMPLDVTDHAKRVNGQPKVYYERINTRTFFSGSGAVTDAPALDAWLRGYLDRMRGGEFDLATVRPPTMAAESNPERRQEQLSEFERQVNEALREARAAERTARDERRPDTEIDALRRRVQALETLDNQHASQGRRHMEREASLRDNAVAVLRRHILERGDHYANNNTVSRQPVPAISDSQGAATQMLRIDPATGDVMGVELRLNDSLVLTQTEGVARTNLHVGSMRELVNHAIDQLPENIREQVRRNLGTYRFGEGGVPITAAESQILRELSEGLRNGLAQPGGDSSWRELSDLVGRQQGAERRAAVEREGLQPLLSPEHARDFVERANRELYERRMFRVSERGQLVFDARGGELSVADLSRRYQETMQELAAARAAGEDLTALQSELVRRRNHLQDALNPANSADPAWRAIRQTPLEALRQSITAVARVGDERARISEAAARALETVLGPRTTVQIDSTGVVQPGHPRVVYTDGRGVPLTIRGYHPGSNELIVERAGVANVRVPVAEVQSTVTLAAGTDPATLSRELLVARTQALTDLTRPMRSVPGMSQERMTELDNRAMEEARRSAFEPGSGRAQVMQDAAETLRQTWDLFGEGRPFPDPRTEAGRRELRDVVDLARIDLVAAARAETDATRKAELQQSADVLDRYHRELALPEGEARPVLEMMNRVVAPEDLLYLRSTRLTPEEARQARERLERYGPNPLGEYEAMRRFTESMLRATREWRTTDGGYSFGTIEDLRGQEQRRHELATRLSQSDSTLRALATDEARLRLGAGAEPAAVNELAGRLLSRRVQPMENGALAVARQNHEALRNEHAALAQRLTEMTNGRAMQIQQIMNEFCRTNGLPPVRLSVSENLGGAQGVYRRGSGEITIPRDQLLDRAGGVQAAGAVYHELIHAQQDQLVLRMLADRASPAISGLRATDAQFRRMQEAYREATGGELNREFLDSVLRLRREGAPEPRRLTAQETSRAEALAESFRTSAPAARERETLSNDLRITQTERSRLSGSDSNAASQNLLRSLNEAGGDRLGERLFGTSDSSRWPEPVRQLLEQWRNAAKDSSGRAQSWNEPAAREVLRLALDARAGALNGRLRESYQRYRDGLHEQEAHLFGGEVERMTQREMIDSLVNSGRQPGRELERAIPGSEAARLRDNARESGMPFASERGMRDLTNVVREQISNWRDDVTSQWEAGAGRRAGMQESFNRALELARRHVAATGSLTGSALEREARRLVDSPTPELSRNREFSEARQQYLQRQAEYFREFGAVHEVMFQRQQQLQSTVDRYTEANGLPRMRLDFRENGSSASGYDRGAGAITINNSDLTGRSRAPHLMAALMGQMAIGHQDAQIVASLIDRVNGAPRPGQPLTPEQVTAIRESYQRSTGSQLDPAFLEQVARGRRQVLTPAQIERADALALSFSQTRQLVQQYEMRARDLRTTERALLQLRGSGPAGATELVARLAGPGGDALAVQLFGNRISELPDTTGIRQLVERYRRASVGGLAPALETAQWSEQGARRLLSTVLGNRARSLSEEQGRAQAEYMERTHAREAAVIGGDAFNRTGEAQAELLRPRESDRPGTELQQAQTRVERRQHEQRFLDLVQAKLREMHPGLAFADLTPRQIEAAMQVVVRDLNGAAGQADFTMFGERLSAAEAASRATAGERLRQEFVRGTAPGANDPAALATRDRVRQHIDPPRREGGARDLSMPFDPWPSERELARLGEGRVVVERTESGVRLRREGTTEEWSSERMPTDEEIRRHIRERIRELQEEIARRERASEPVRAEERALLESLTRMEARLNDPRAMEGIRGNARPTLGRTRAAVGSTIGIGIIVSAALGWYIRAHEGGRRPPGLQSIDLPGV